MIGDVELRVVVGDLKRLSDGELEKQSEGRIVVAPGGTELLEFDATDHATRRRGQMVDSLASALQRYASADERYEFQLLRYPMMGLNALFFHLRGETANYRFLPLAPAPSPFELRVYATTEFVEVARTLARDRLRSREHELYRDVEGRLRGINDRDGFDHSR